MLIGQLSQSTGFSRDTIRYYEKIGLLATVRKKRINTNNYKDYPEETVQRLQAIRKFKDLGFTLEEIRELLVLATSQVLELPKLIQIVEFKITGIDSEIDKLHEYKLRLAREHQLLLNRKTGHTITLPQLEKMAA